MAHITPAYNLALAVDCTDAQIEQEEVSQEYEAKLMFEGGMLSLPDPRRLNYGWVNAPLNILDTTYDKVKS